MGTFWTRQYRLVFPEINLEYSDTLRMSFSIKKDLTSEPNEGNFKIWNLNPDNRKKIEKPDQRVDLYAGYRDNGGVVKMWAGNITQVVSKEEGQDITTEIKAGDGAMQLRDNWFSLNYPAGTAGDVIVKRIGQEMGLPVTFGEDAHFGTFESGYSFMGIGRDALDAICYGSGVTWSIQNGVLQIILNGGTTTQQGLVLAPDSGLIGSPERIVKSNPKPDKDNPKQKKRKETGKVKYEKKAGWRIKTLLVPTVNPGDAIKIESRLITGWFRVETITHSGDYRGGDWTSEMELVEGLKPLEAKNSAD